MKTKILAFAIASAILLQASAAFACLSGSYVLNDRVTLFGNRIEDHNIKTPITQELIDQSRFHCVRNSNGQKTHCFLIQKVDADQRAIMSTEYVVQDQLVGTTKRIRVETNYKAPKVRVRGSVYPAAPKVNPVDEVYGCGWGMKESNR